VMAGHFSSASLTSAAQCSPGMPRGRLRHPLTVDTASDSHSATAAVPPSASIIDPHVHVDSSIAIQIVRNSRTCQRFATCETTFPVRYGPIDAVMINDDDIIQRLIAVRKKLGYEKQADFAKALGLGKNVYNPFEKGTRPLTLDAARRIRKRFGISADWLLFGDIGQPNEAMALELGPNPDAEETETVSKKQARARKRA
jgi:transcriptional regulator with XRE-family HTH domain